MPSHVVTLALDARSMKRARPGPRWIAGTSPLLSGLRSTSRRTGCHRVCGSPPTQPPPVKGEEILSAVSITSPSPFDGGGLGWGCQPLNRRPSVTARSVSRPATNPWPLRLVKQHSPTNTKKNQTGQPCPKSGNDDPGGRRGRTPCWLRLRFGSDQILRAAPSGLHHQLGTVGGHAGPAVLDHPAFDIHVDGLGDQDRLAAR